MNIKVGASSDVGRVRDANQDAYLIDAPLYVIADGMGGHAAGDVAAVTAVKVISDEAGRVSAQEPDSLAALLKDANAAIWERAQSERAFQGMGTTCTLVYASDAAGYIAHVGDSRAYRLRGGGLEQLTEDHTLVGRMIKEGRIGAGEARTHPQRNVITRALGIDSSVEVDLREIDLEEGDRLMLCSDGLSSMLDESAIEKGLAEAPDPQAAADRLVELANDAGGEDNITVVVLDVAGGDGPAPAGAVVPARSDQEPRVDTQPDAQPGTKSISAGSDDGRSERRRRAIIRRRRLVVSLVVLVVVLGGGYAAARWALDNSFYIGASDSGAISIYRGIPEEIGGLTLAEVERETSLALEDLPESRREDVILGMKVESLADADTTVSNLQDIARAYRRETAPTKDNP
ncbi:MAG: Stp1/IreP family PP2C-type Ser/Thr phosphatase [Actinobacteria bacterium]|nr:Stp1/IreP family PP2C-type Ser/Thr phosphatase [Actinomycetota bacterium]